MALKIMQWNARGIRTNINELKNFIIKTTNKPDIICIEETNLKDKDNLRIEGYLALRHDNPTRQIGGLAMLIREGINHTLLQIDNNTEMEYMGVEINTNHGKIKIINVYASPTREINKQDLETLFPDRRAIAVGDFNAHHKLWKSTINNARGKDLEEVVQERDLVVLNTGQPTLNPTVNTRTNSVIDLAIVTRDMALRCSHHVLDSSLGSNHKATMTKVDEEVDEEESSGMHRWALNKADWKIFKDNSKIKINNETIAND